MCQDPGCAKGRGCCKGELGAPDSRLELTDGVRVRDTNIWRSLGTFWPPKVLRKRAPTATQTATEEQEETELDAAYARVGEEELPPPRQPTARKTIGVGPAGNTRQRKAQARRRKDKAASSQADRHRGGPRGGAHPLGGTAGPPAAKAANPPGGTARPPAAKASSPRLTTADNNRLEGILARRRHAGLQERMRGRVGGAFAGQHLAGRANKGDDMGLLAVASTEAHDAARRAGHRRGKPMQPPAKRHHKDGGR